MADSTLKCRVDFGVGAVGLADRGDVRKGALPTKWRSHCVGFLVRSIQGYCNGESTGQSNLEFRKRSVVFVLDVEQWTISTP